MKSNFWFMCLCLVILAIGLSVGSLISQQKANPAQQLEIALQENAKLKIQLETWETSYRKEIIKNAVLNGKIQGINDGIDKATGLLQKGYDSGKLNYKEIWDCGFRINIDTSSVYQRPGKSKDRKDKK